MNDNEEKEYLLKCTLSDILGYQSLSYLFTKYKSFKKIFESHTDEWEEISQTVKKRWNKEKNHEKYRILEEYIHAKKIQWHSVFDETYPQLLKEISSPPVIVYYQGSWEAIHTTSLGVVGTRMMSVYGEQVVNDIIPRIAKQGITITSGFQKGIDQAAHKATVEVNGTTIAVLGTGIDVRYPVGSERLFDKIMKKNGLIISEYPPTTQAFKQNFPRRNRIISGISQGVLVVEAALKSGSLITARYAAEQGREVYAVPGSIFSSLSEGTHYLIAQGAKIVQNANDIVIDLLPQKSSAVVSDPSFSSEIQRTIYMHLKLNPLTFDELAVVCNLPLDQLSAELTLMELQGMLKLAGNGQYVRV